MTGVQTCALPIVKRRVFFHKRMICLIRRTTMPLAQPFKRERGGGGGRGEGGGRGGGGIGEGGGRRGGREGRRREGGRGRRQLSIARQRMADICNRKPTINMLT